MNAILQLVALFVAFASVSWCADVPVNPGIRSESRRLAPKTKAPTTSKSTKAPTWSPTFTASAAPSSCELELPETVQVDIKIQAECSDNITHFNFVDFAAFTPLKNFTGFNSTPVTDSFPIPVEGCTRLDAFGRAIGEACSNAIASIVVAGAIFFDMQFDTPSMFFGTGCADLIRTRQ